MIITNESPLWPILLDAIFGPSPCGVLTARTRGFRESLTEFTENPDLDPQPVAVLERKGMWEGQPDPGVSVAFERIADGLRFVNRRLADGEEGVILRYNGRVELRTADARIDFTRLAIDDAVEGLPGFGRIRERDDLRFGFME